MRRLFLAKVASVAPQGLTAAPEGVRDCASERAKREEERRTLRACAAAADESRLAALEERLCLVQRLGEGERM
jgi:hypothetical protein